ncbi:MAG: response regulator [Rhodothermales bacterium]
MKFLVVDDSPTMRRIVANTLKEIGYDSDPHGEAGDGAEALARLEADQYDCLITDWNMPNMNGLELTQAVRAHPTYANLPILMVTTRGMKEDVIAAMKARVNNYVVKPFTPDVLRDKIETILKYA